MSGIHCLPWLYADRAVRYDEIRSLYIHQLVSAWMDTSTMHTTKARVNRKIDSFVIGDLDYAMEILSTLWEVENHFI